jgi:hypothetical protein
VVDIIVLREKTMKSNQQTLDDKKIDLLFKKFSRPMVKPCTSDSQREKAIQISQILWLLLVTDTDSEKNIYDTLHEIFNDHEGTVAMGSLYFYKMKAALKPKEVSRLTKHYSNHEVFSKMKDWETR